MRKLLIFLLFVFLLIQIASAEKPEDVKLNGFVNDYANVLDDNQEGEISGILKELYDNKTAQVAVVIVSSLEGIAKEDFAYKVAEGKLGDKEKDNGLLLLISVQDREYRFEVGRGLEPILNDAKIGRVGRERLVPFLKNDDYYNGILGSAKEIREIINNPKYAEDYKDSYDAYRNFVIFGVLGFIIIVILIVVISEARKTKTGKKERLFVAGAIAGSMMRTGYRGGSGGFGGFGGGSFGGGGSGGRF